MRTVLRQKIREWRQRYLIAELLGTGIGLAVALITYLTSDSYLIAAGIGWVGEGAGFFGFLITRELIMHAKTYAHEGYVKRFRHAATVASTNLIVEFLPAELIDSFIIRPVTLFIFPQYLHPYALGFLVGKLAADVFFYAFAIAGYELQKHLRQRHATHSKRRRSASVKK